MTKQQLKIVGIALLAVCAFCLFVAAERYQNNASKVEAMNQTGAAMLFGQGDELKPGVPAISTYSLFFAVVTGIAGAALTIKSLDISTAEASAEDPAKPPKE